MSYYKEHAKDFIDNTFNCDMSTQYCFFEKHLNKKGTILDVGFGSGRDSIYFKSKGYDVYSIDPEEEFVLHAKELGLKKAYRTRVEDIDFVNKFDGIWACASLLHISSSDLASVFKKLDIALKDKGILYVSFKYGDYEGIRNGRFFLDLNEEKVATFIKDTHLMIKEILITKDVRPEKEEKWLNVIMIKDSFESKRGCK